MAIREKEVSLEKLRAWLNDPNTSHLTEDEKQAWERIDFAYDQLKIETPPHVVNRMMKKFNITRAQASRDLQLCNSLLAPQNRIDLGWLRNFIIDDALLQIKVAQETLDHKAWTSGRNTLEKVYLQELSTQAPIDPELLGGNNYFALINMNGQLQKIDLNKVVEMPQTRREKLTEFIFEDISEDTAKIMLES